MRTTRADLTCWLELIEAARVALQQVPRNEPLSEDAKATIAAGLRSGYLAATSLKTVIR